MPIITRVNRALGCCIAGKSAVAEPSLCTRTRPPTFAPCTPSRAADAASPCGATKGPRKATWALDLELAGEVPMKPSTRQAPLFILDSDFARMPIQSPSSDSTFMPSPGSLSELLLISDSRSISSTSGSSSYSKKSTRDALPSASSEDERDDSECADEALLADGHSDADVRFEHGAWRRLARSASVERLCAEPRRPPLPIGKPIVVERLHAFGSVDEVRRALLTDEEHNPLAMFLNKSIKCRDVSMTTWLDCGHSLVQVSKYEVPVPKDTPEMIRRAFGLPDFVRSTMVSSLGFEGETLVLRQAASSEGILYSDRVRMVNMHTFSLHPSGGVEWRQWSEAVWLKPLPWTHGFLTKVIQQRAVEEAEGQSKNFAASLQQAVR
mmetsp:Transcript_162136/g.519945  ORF Transcript_162136/g.519945 Transcript_162136/m.519945 type:complete len:381 (-) Transcript_162136:123-1265(-)|eukprot:CAMPEP_0203921038 /NCGR_PEP_ID=MMETSP0359-20131031/61247_1 /ASSEMBLY_ACC=CAM_ASM_000338 /TAXON_ID=268821 /ORGANISM="Scrippsiella Hangoei, Strain SHTV-5" /LENGTH=380 /DNA_ID=CAMNT_0050848649 /DNA_START=41 /DNA_END=1183 /DNA_ORIENTATION=+